MRRKNRSTREVPPKLFKYAYFAVGGVFLVAALLYIAGLAMQRLTPEQKVFASPYSLQNEFHRADILLKEKGYEIESQQISQDKSELIITLKEGPKVIFTHEQDIAWQISSLHSIIDRLTIEDKRPKTIDFRFGKPIVKF